MQKCNVEGFFLFEVQAVRFCKRLEKFQRLFLFKYLGKKRLINKKELLLENGADYRNRTGDLLITSQLLYLLS